MVAQSCKKYKKLSSNIEESYIYMNYRVNQGNGDCAIAPSYSMMNASV